MRTRRIPIGFALSLASAAGLLIFAAIAIEREWRNERSRARAEARAALGSTAAGLRAELERLLADLAGQLVATAERELLGEWALARAERGELLVLERREPLWPAPAPVAAPGTEDERLFAFVRAAHARLDESPREELLAWLLEPLEKLAHSGLAAEAWLVRARLWERAPRAAQKAREDRRRALAGPADYRRLFARPAALLAALENLLDEPPPPRRAEALADLERAVARHAEALGAPGILTAAAAEAGERLADSGLRTAAREVLLAGARRAADLRALRAFLLAGEGRALELRGERQLLRMARRDAWRAGWVLPAGWARGRLEAFEQLVGGRVRVDRDPGDATPFEPLGPGGARGAVGLVWAAPPAPGWGARGVLVIGLAALLLAALALGLVTVLRAARREAQAARTQAEFVANVAHELRTPASSIQLYAEMLAAGQVTGDEQRAEFQRTLHAESQRLSRLVERVLAMAAHGAGRPPGPPAAVGAILGVLEAACEGRGALSVRIEAGAGACRVPDGEGCIGALRELVENALRHGAGAVELSAQRSSRGIEFRVADRGLGIAPAERRRIFERFERGGDPLTRPGGAGLGLALVRAFAQARGGAVRAEERPGGGALLCLELPLVETETTP